MTALLDSFRSDENLAKRISEFLEAAPPSARFRVLANAAVTMLADRLAEAETSPESSPRIAQARKDVEQPLAAAWEDVAEVGKGELALTPVVRRALGVAEQLAAAVETSGVPLEPSTRSAFLLVLATEAGQWLNSQLSPEEWLGLDDPDFGR